MKDPPSEKERIEKTPPQTSAAPSPAGIKAIQGLHLPPSESQPDVARIRALAPREEVSAAPPLDASAANDLEIAAQRADASKATHWHHPERGSGRLVEYYRVRSEISEVLACANVKDGVRADPYSVSGANFPNYDVLGPEECSSVKAYSLKNGEPRMGQYRKDFSQLVNPASEKNQSAASRLMEIRETNPAAWEQLAPHLPPAVRQAKNGPAMQRALADHAILRFPVDQIQKVRADLCNDIQANLARYGLNAEMEPAALAREAQRLTHTRILPIDDRYATAHYQQKAADVIRQRDQLVVDRKASR